MNAVQSAPWSSAPPAPRPMGIAKPSPTCATAPLPTSDTVSFEPAGLVQASMDETRAGLGELSFPPLDPFAASVASTMWSKQHGAFRHHIINVVLPGELRFPLPVEVCLQNGRLAPMLVIFPGVGGDSEASHVRMLAQQALDHGMNYTVLPNSWSDAWLAQMPAHDPGNLPWESQVARETLDALKADYPLLYSHVSAVGYSYGGMLGAAVVADQAKDASVNPVINGSFAAISPPENLLDSMDRLDHLRQEYHDASDWMSVAAKYAGWVAYYGYPQVMESPIATRETRDVEKFLADTNASRQHQQHAFEYVDAHDGVNALPLNHEIAEHGPNIDRKRRAQLRAAQDQALVASTYGTYATTYLTPDLMKCGQTSSLQDMAEQYRYSHLIKEASGRGVPVVTLSSADDYILLPENVDAFRELEAHPAADQATRVLDHGGHVGLLFNPDVREQVMAFLAHPPPTP